MRTALKARTNFYQRKRTSLQVMLVGGAAAEQKLALLNGWLSERQVAIRFLEQVGTFRPGPTSAQSPGPLSPIPLAAPCANQFSFQFFDCVTIIVTTMILTKQIGI